MFKSKVTDIQTFTKPGGGAVIQLTVPLGYHLNDLDPTFDYVEIKKQPRKRSNNANAALWKMLTEMAAKQSATKEELYIKALQDYGKVVEHLAVPESSVERISGQFRHVVNRGKVTLNGKENVHLECYYGSSRYTKDEFQPLLQGVIDDAKEMGIEFVSAEERDRLLEEWE